MLHRPPFRPCTLCLLGAALAIAAPARGDDPHPEWTLYTPYGGSTLTYLVDLDGAVVHTWPSGFLPGVSVYLADGGAILRTANDGSALFGGPGTGGRIERIAWDGTVEWSYVVSKAGGHCGGGHLTIFNNGDGQSHRSCPGDLHPGPRVWSHRRSARSFPARPQGTTTCLESNVPTPAPPT